MACYLNIFIIFILIASCAPNKSVTESTVSSRIDTLLVGTYTTKGSEGIYMLQFDNQDGSLKDLGLVAEAVSPSFMAWNSDRSALYTVNEIKIGGVSAFKTKTEDTGFSLLNHVSSEGASPCHVSVSQSGKVLASCNYQSGNVVFYPIMNDGSIGEDLTTRMNEGQPGPHERQAGPHAHCGMFGKDDRFLYVVDLGLDKIIAYPINENGEVGEGHTAMTLDPGDGPRHLTFHPSKNMAFVINELSSTIVSMSVDHTNGLFQRIDKKSTLPQGFDGKSQCADIHMTSEGKYLYGSNRGHNSIAVFEVDENGNLNLLEVESTQGEWPRNFAISPVEHHLIVANQNTDNITVFAIDRETGLLDYTGKQAAIFSPTCLIFK